VTFSRAIVRTPSEDFAEGLTTAELGAPDLALALSQHGAYVDALRRCGLEVTVLAPEPGLPDATFVEDDAVLLPHTAILTRPGAPSRAPEVPALAPVIAEFFPSVHAIEAPGTLDGGDICEAGRVHFIGLSARTNEAGAFQLARILETEGRRSTIVDIRGKPGILHLKSGIASIGDDRLVAVEALADHAAFAGFEIVRVAGGEEYAANCVRIRDSILVAAGYPHLEEALSAHGYPTVALPVSEFRKMNGGLSCLSLRW
jgi:dimethylargininase